MSDTTKFVEAVGGALKGLGKADAVASIGGPAVAGIAEEMGAAFKASGKEKLDDFLTEDDETNRLVMAGVALANEINSTTDWSAVPGAVMKGAYIALKAALAIAAVVG